MKNEIILWLCSIVLVFLIGYFKNVTDSNYPVTGTFGIEGKKVSYKLDRVAYEKSSYKNYILTDIEGIEASLLLQNNSEESSFRYSIIDKGLMCQIPKLAPGQKINYKVILSYKNNSFEIPKKEFVTLTFWGSIPTFVRAIYFILMYGVILLTLRGLLEAFTKNVNLKKFMFINCTLLLLLITIIYPLYISYKLEAINHFVPTLGNLTDPWLLIVLLSWIVGTILIFKAKYVKTVSSLISVMTLLIFFFELMK